MTLFKNVDVFDPDYVPPILFFRDRQIRELAAFLGISSTGNAPVNVLCIGAPATGKTTTIKHVTSEFDDEDNIIVSYVRCLSLKEPYRIFSKIFEDVCNHPPPPTGVSKRKIVENIWQKLEDRVLIVVLDDLSLLKPAHASEIIYELLKAPDEYHIKVGVVATSLDAYFPILLDPFAGSVFKYYQLLFPPYTKEEIEVILRWRVEKGFEPGAYTDEAFEEVVNLTYKAGDLRYGIYLLKTSGKLAELRNARKVEIDDVRRAYKGEPLMYLVKMLAALNSDERAVLRYIYEGSELEGEVTAKLIYEAVKLEVGMSYKRFYTILEKLERLRLIDTIVRRGRGLVRHIIPRYDREIVLEALRF